MFLSELKWDIAYSYELAAAGFSRHADKHVYRHLAGPLVQFLGPIQGVVLDVASGSGAVARLLPRVVALDISRNLLKANDALIRVQADAAQLPFRDDSFAAATCAFGLNHFPRPEIALAELARVAPLIGVVTWKRPEKSFAPAEAVFGVIERHCGRARSPVGEAVERMSVEVGSEPAVAALLAAAGLAATVTTVGATIPWPGTESFVDYRLSMLGSLAKEADMPRLRADAIAAVDRLASDQLTWAPDLVMAVARRPAVR
jgi:SAM-dependent methyltransferase